MPHCWPQKQQCVLTSRSGSTLVDSRIPLIDERCGPKRSMIRSGSPGTSATAAILPLVRHLARPAGSGSRPCIQVLTPQLALRETEKGAPAAWTHLLVMAAVSQFVTEPELAFDDRQVADHRDRRIRLAAAPALCLLLELSGIFVEADTELCRPLKYVEQLAERKPEERHNHRSGMQ